MGRDAPQQAVVTRANMTKDMAMNPGANHEGFTLTELLIVVVIIGILASLTIPRFFGHAEKAATAEAIAIMGPIHRALLQYHDEHGRYPGDLGADGIKDTLSINFEDSRNGWNFSTDASGHVTASRTNGNLTLQATGVWTGDGDYDPENGQYWPNLK